MNAPAVKSTCTPSKNDGYHYISGGHATTGFQKMHTMQRQGKYCDVIITVGEEVFCGHKIVFATMGEYFSNMFDKHGTTENCEVHIDDISPVSFNLILLFLYTGEIRITAVNVEELILASNKFMIESLESACREALPTLLNPLTWAKIKAIAGAQMYKDLYQICHSYSLKHFEEIIKTSTFLQLPFSEVKELIADDQLEVWADEMVYSAVLNWVKHDLPNREPHLAELMSFVKFPLIDKIYMMKNVAREPLMRDNPECYKLLLEATEYHLGMQCEQASSRTQQRKCVKKYIFVTGGQSGTLPNGMSECELYNPKTNTWHSFSSMQCKRSHHGLVGFRRLLYAFGGFDGPTLSSAEYYDQLKDSWHMTTSLPNGRYAHGVCSIDNSIYICGGRNSQAYLNSVNKFDPVTAAYMTSPPMKTSRSHFNMAVSDNCIYAIGGRTDGGQDLKSMEIFDPREGKWSEAPSKSIPGVYLTVAVLDGFIYTSSRTGVLGCDWERFNIRSNKWETISNTSNEEDHLNHDGCLYMLGSCIESIQKYDCKKNSVIQMPPMINKRIRMGAVMMDSIEISRKLNDS